MTIPPSQTAAPAPDAQKVSVRTLAGMVVGSVVGGGVFTLPANLAGAAGVWGTVLAWTIAGAGMLTLALVFQSLAIRRPDLDDGIYVYAQDGLGRYAGFNAAWGYWASNVVTNVFFLTFAMTTLGTFFPGLGQGNTVLAVLISSVVVWVLHALIARGIRQAVVVNRIVTTAKLVPILVFVAITAVAFDPGVFADNLWDEDEGHSLWALMDQAKDSMLVVVFVFIGIEGASVYSRMARRREDVGRATLLGFFSTLALFVSVTMVSYGVLPQHELAEARQPSMGAVLESVVGEWGANLIAVGVVVSVFGAYLAWTLVSAEMLFSPARTEVMPRALARENRHGTPGNALLTTNVSVQLFLVVVLFVDDALDLTLKLATSLILVPYFLVAAYALKLAVTGETYGPRDAGLRRRELVVSVLAVGFAIFMLYAAGPAYLVLNCLIYAPGTVLYRRARRERGEPVFTRPELVGCLALWGSAAIGVVALAAGWVG
ncbi:basic amino acid/polyamine antiporter [Nocardioides campestrisoli]|uniref:basic amino acid/polyamine antiporter n=1 Tax=Nocardioides campestrisoli TaxID=2736757 RepID=UPI0015E77235|nr:basic amino acid/polyamine antiporter [Nocardioides campestrisoli]